MKAYQPNRFGSHPIHAFLLALLILVPTVLMGSLLYLYSLQPHYSGRLNLAGLSEAVEVIFDPYGIPHIYGQNRGDVYLALGYVHAQERLFQMEMIRRTAAGRLAEVLGERLVKTDKFFRTLGILEQAQKNAAEFDKYPSSPYKKLVLAYLAGINQFIKHGSTPLEFRLLGIPKAEFTSQDIYLSGALIAFGFASGFRIDPLVTKAYQNLGWDYLKDWGLGWPPSVQKNPVYPSNYSLAAETLSHTINEILDNLPVAPWLGSNGWVISGRKTQSGQVIFANDTHMSYMQPAVWFEAHLECPGFSLYGYHAAGIPFALIGHNRYLAWGLTMFQNDDVDFYKERPNPHNSNQVWFVDRWQDLKIRHEMIEVKDEKPVNLEVRISRHGPILNEVDDAVANASDHPVAVSWMFNKFSMQGVQQAFFRLANAASMDEARRAASMIDVVGVNVMYGDRDGNIAWWASAKLIKRPAHVNSKLFLDGASGRDEPLGYYDFTQNPRSENPPSGFVYSANNQPVTLNGNLYPGYYMPDDRARRIIDYLDSKTIWSVESTQKMNMDCRSMVSKEVTAEILNILKDDGIVRRTSLHRTAIEVLQNWNGDHQTTDVAPTIYNWLLSNIMENAMADELGIDDYKAFNSTQLMKSTIPVLIKNDASLWWDNVHTSDHRETRQMIFARSYDQTIKALTRKLGPNILEWQWGRVHTLEHRHLFGLKKPLNVLFNVGPFAAMGGNETIVNTGFKLNSKGQFPVYYGPTMRVVIDFADIDNSQSVNPTGQSGFFLSDHYDDQAHLFNSGKFRKQMINRIEIENSRIGTLIFSPR